MSVTRRRTLAEAHLALEAMISDVATLLEVVADDDMPDAYDDYSLQGRFTRQSAQRFAEQLVYRLLHDDDFILEWRGSEDERRHHERPSEADEEEADVRTPDLADHVEYERQRRIEHATSLRTGDEVQRVGRKPRGTVEGRDADNPERLQVRWHSTGKVEWWHAVDLQAAAARRTRVPLWVEEMVAPADTSPEVDPMLEVDEIDLGETDQTPEAIATKIVEETRKR